ncbi:MAG: hypothetical protein U0Q15_08810 [Kineosporiaceae bacterium]
MTDTTERALREALASHVADVDWTTLRRRELEPASTRAKAPGRPLLIAAAAAAIVLAVGVTGKAVVDESEHDAPATAAADTSANGTMRPFIGKQWWIVSVKKGQDPDREIPSDVGAFVRWDADGTFHVNDGTNYYQGPWREGPDGFSVGQMGGTWVAYAGPDPARRAAMDALQLVMGFDGRGAPTSAVRRGAGGKALLIVPSGAATLTLATRR